MQVEIVDSGDALSKRAAELLAGAVREAVANRGRCVLALSGGTEPWVAFRCLALHALPWHAVHILQVDERAAPAHHPQRNWTHLEETLLGRVPIPPAQIHAMPVEHEPLADAARRYAAVLAEVAGSPPVIDLVHLGLGDDGHTASLVPEDPALEVDDAEVTATGVYQGWRRMTLTFAAINRARRVFWLVAGSGKAGALQRLIAADARIPAGRVQRNAALLLTDRRTASGPAIRP